MAGTKHFFFRFLLSAWLFLDCGLIRVGAAGCACRHPAPPAHGKGSGQCWAGRWGWGLGAGASSTTSKFPGSKAVPWKSHQDAAAVVALAQFSLLWILRPAATSVSFPACFPHNLNVFSDKLYLSYLLIVYFHIKKIYRAVIWM